MKKAIIVPPSVMEINRVEDNNRILREVLAKEFSFDMLLMDNIDLSLVARYDLIFIDPFKYLNKKYVVNTMRLLSMPVKILAYGADIENVKMPEKDFMDFVRNRSAFYLRADKILCDVYENFKVVCADIFEKIKSKMVWWPKCVANYDRYFNLPFNESPILKCTLAGKLDDRYALRRFIFETCGGMVKYYAHPGYGKIDTSKFPTGDRFAKELNQYVCGACPTKVNVNHVTEKHVIIPAAGSLLLTERTADFDRLGMTDGVHYVSINRETVSGIIEDVIGSPEKYRDIRFSGREYIKQHHTIRNRIEEIRPVLKELGDE